MNKGLCPKCGAVIARVEIEAVPVTQNGVPKWNGVSYHCPGCRVVLGFQIDPVALHVETVQETVDGVVQFLRGKKEP
jgi:predicted RNA-binding Zn-ribbon protein involved in translation (DUF1610 family)